MTVSRVAQDFLDSELEDRDPDDPILGELLAFETRFAQWVAAVGTGELLGRFMNELRVAQRQIQTGSSEFTDQLGRLRSTLNEIQSIFERALPHFQSEVRFQSLAAGLADFRRALTSPEIPEPMQIEAALRDLASRWQTVRLPESTFLNGNGAPNGLKVVIDTQLKQIKEITERQYNARASVSAEMRTVHARIAVIESQRKAASGPCDLLDVEFDGLIDRLGRLITRLSALP